MVYYMGGHMKWKIDLSICHICYIISKAFGRNGSSQIANISGILAYINPIVEQQSGL